MATISQKRLQQLYAGARESFTAELNQLPFKPKVRQTLIDGFSDGVRAGLRALLNELHIDVVEGE